MSAVLAEAALGYAARGWPVLPLHSWAPQGCSCGDPNCQSPAKHPRTAHGLNDATCDQDVVRSWWDRWRRPAPNIGLLTGVVFDALDIDSPEALDVISSLMPDQASSVDGPTVKTPRGWHCYVAPTGHGNTVNLGGLRGVDWRGKGGYVVAPPSVKWPAMFNLVDGWSAGTYWEWLLPDDPDFGPVAPVQPPPPWLVALLQPPPPLPLVGNAGPAPLSKYGQRALEGEVARVVMAPEGQRNNQLNNSALALGQLVGGGVLSAGEVGDALLMAATRAGLPEREADRTIRSGLTAGLRSPRQPKELHP